MIPPSVWTKRFDSGSTRRRSCDERVTSWPVLPVPARCIPMTRLRRELQRILGDKRLKDLPHKVLVASVQLDSKASDPEYRSWRPRSLSNLDVEGGAYLNGLAVDIASEVGCRAGDLAGLPGVRRWRNVCQRSKHARSHQSAGRTSKSFHPGRTCTRRSGGYLTVLRR